MNKQINTIRKQFYTIKRHYLWTFGIQKGLIQKFDNDFYKRLENIYFGGIPMSLRIKYMRPKYGPGQCYDRSLFITMGFDDAILVRGNNLDLELSYGIDNAGHGWVEHDGWVYDPTTLYRYKKELYYRMYQPTKTSYYAPADYAEKEWYKDIINTTISDLKPGGRKRYELLMSIPLVKGAAELANDTTFLNELNQHLELVEYDYNQIYEEIEEGFKLLLEKKPSVFSASANQ